MGTNTWLVAAELETVAQPVPALSELVCIFQTPAEVIHRPAQLHLSAAYCEVHCGEAVETVRALASDELPLSPTEFVPVTT